MRATQRLTLAIGAVAVLFIGATVALLLADRDNGSPTGNPALAQELNEAQSIDVQGEGQIAVAPDIAHAVIGVEIEGDDIESLRSDADSRMSAVIDGLQADGIPEEDIQTVTYDISVQREPPRPVEERSSPGAEPDEPVTDDQVTEEATESDPEITGYRLLHLVQVRMTDIDAVGQIIDNSLSNGANNVGGIHFEVDDREGAIRQAREQAVDDARDKAQHLAELGGVSLGQPVRIAESSPSLPPVRAEEAAAGMDADVAAASIEPGESIVTVHVNIVYAIE